MGNTSFLTGGSSGSPQSVEDSIRQLENASVLFLNGWQSTPQNLERASRASGEAMKYLDHIVNEILRVRDHLKSENNYSNSALETHLSIEMALWVDNVTRNQQEMLTLQGPGNGVLPSTGSPLTMEKLLNKIKHRRPKDANFRVGSAGEHFFLFAVDKPNQKPDSIVEFIVNKFCNHCASIVPLL